MAGKNLKELVEYLKKNENTTFISEDIIYQIKYDTKNKKIIIPHIYITDNKIETFCISVTYLKNFVIEQDAFRLTDYDLVPLYKKPRQKVLYFDQLNIEKLKKCFYQNVLNSNEVEYIIIHYKNGRNIKINWNDRKQELRYKTMVKICNLFNSIYRITIFYGFEEIDVIEDKATVQKIKNKMLNKNIYQIKERKLVM